MNDNGGSTSQKAAGPRTRRIVVSLLKGGVAKSETAVNLAHGMAKAGLRVLLVDTDVQAQCNDMLGATPTKGLADVISGWTNAQGGLFQARDNLWLLAGGNDLAAVKMEIARREMAPEAVLDETLAQYEGQFDAMVIDTAPGWDTLLVNALYCSREVLSPVSMEPVALSGLIRFEERLEIIKKYNKDLALKWIVPTFVDGRVKKSGEILGQLRERYGDMVATPIKYSVKLSEAPAFGKTIYEYDPKGPGAQAYQELTQRVMKDAPEAQAGLLAPTAETKPTTSTNLKIFLQEQPPGEDPPRESIARESEAETIPTAAKNVIDLKTGLTQPDSTENPPLDAGSEPENKTPALLKPKLRKSFLKQRLASFERNNEPQGEVDRPSPGSGSPRPLGPSADNPVPTASQFEENLILKLKDRLKQRGYDAHIQQDDIIEKIRQRFKSGSA